MSRVAHTEWTFLLNKKGELQASVNHVSGRSVLFPPELLAEFISEDRRAALLAELTAIEADANGKVKAALREELRQLGDSGV